MSFINFLSARIAQILDCNWLYTRKQEGAILPARDYPRKKTVVFFNFLFFYMINPVLTKLAWSRWLGIGLILFSRSTFPSLNTSKEGTCLIFSHLDRKSLVNNLSIMYVRKYGQRKEKKKSLLAPSECLLYSGPM